MVSWEQLVLNTVVLHLHTRFYNVFPLTDNGIDKNTLVLFHSGGDRKLKWTYLSMPTIIRKPHFLRPRHNEPTDLFWWMTENSSALIARKKTIGRCGGFSSRAAAIKTLRFSVGFGHVEWATWAAARFLICAKTCLILKFALCSSMQCQILLRLP